MAKSKAAAIRKIEREAEKMTKAAKELKDLQAAKRKKEAARKALQNAKK